jgi:hypothetical protein
MAKCFFCGGEIRLVQAADKTAFNFFYIKGQLIAWDDLCIKKVILPYVVGMSAGTREQKIGIQAALNKMLGDKTIIFKGEGRDNAVVSV